MNRRDFLTTAASVPLVAALPGVEASKTITFKWIENGEVRWQVMECEKIHYPRSGPVVLAT